MRVHGRAAFLTYIAFVIAFVLGTGCDGAIGNGAGGGADDTELFSGAPRNIVTDDAGVEWFVTPDGSRVAVPDGFVEPDAGVMEEADASIPPMEALNAAICLPFHVKSAAGPAASARGRGFSRTLLLAAARTILFMVLVLSFAGKVLGETRVLLVPGDRRGLSMTGIWDAPR